jgi:hypothetical protein
MQMLFRKPCTAAQLKIEHQGIYILLQLRDSPYRFGHEKRLSMLKVIMGLSNTVEIHTLDDDPETTRIFEKKLAKNRMTINYKL